MTQWSNLTRNVVIAVGLVLIGWLLYAFRALVSPLIVAALLAYTLRPLGKVGRYVRCRLLHLDPWPESGGM